MKLIAFAGLTVFVCAQAFAEKTPDVGQPCLGVRIQNGSHGAQIVEVFPGFPADLAGLVAGDELAAIDGRAVLSGEAFVTTIERGYRVGDRVELTVWRDGRRSTRSVILDRYPESSELFHRRWIGRTAPPLPAGGGVTVVFLVGDLYREFGCDATCAALWNEVAELGSTGGPGLRVLLVGGARAPRSAGRGVSALSDAAGLLHDRFHVGERPALVIIDRDGWVLFAETGPELALSPAKLALAAALESHTGVVLDR